MKTVMLVHGAWHGAWCWDKVVAGLEARGVPTVAVNMPLAGLAVDADAARTELDALDGDVVLCGHSYGGFVISRMTSPDRPPTNVSHLVYLCAFMTPEGTDVGAWLVDHGSDLATTMVVDDRGLTVMDDAIRPSFYADCSDEDVARATSLLRPVPVGLPDPPRLRAGYEAIPTTYVVCTQDRAIPLAVQQLMAPRAQRVVEWDTSHSPFLSRPDLVVDLLSGLAGA